MHLGITGTRKGLTEIQFDTILKFVEEGDIVSHFHHGDAVGVDCQVAQIIYSEYYAGRIICHPPIKPHFRGYGPYDELREEKDYLVRDQDMVNEINYLWACPDGLEKIRSGTWATIRMARRKGIPITIVMPNGEIIYE